MDKGLPAQKVAVQQLPPQGRGLVARQRLSKGELLLRVPMSLVLSEERVLQESPLLQQLVGDMKLPNWTVLALWLAQQRHLAERGGGSGWGPYLEVLPERPGTVLDWKDGEVDCLLSPGLRTKANIILAANAATWHEIAPIVRDAEASGACPKGMFTPETIKWGVGQLLSRSVRLDSAGGDTVLVPFADFANHAVEADCYLDYDAVSGSVGVRLDRGYTAGEQVFISYGPKSSGELLLSYGFAPPPGQNPYDAVFLDIELPGEDDGAASPPSSSAAAAGSGSPRANQQRRKKRQQQQQQPQPQQQPPPPGGGRGLPSCVPAPVLAAKRAAMRSRGVPEAETFGVRMDALPEGLLEYIAFVDAPARDKEEVERLAEALLSRGDLPVLPDGTPTEALALEGLARRCKEALRGYEQDPAADKQLAASVPGGGGYEQREALCAAIRLRERAILSRTEFLSLQRAKAIRRGRQQEQPAERR